MAAKDIRFVRIKPFNPRLGQTMRKYTHLPTGKRFEESAGWYRVDAALAKYLETVKMVEDDPRSPDAFDVCTEAEAKAVDEREKKAKDRKEATEANDLTTTDLVGGRRLTSDSTTSPADERRQRRAAAATRDRPSRSMS